MILFLYPVKENRDNANQSTNHIYRITEVYKISKEPMKYPKKDLMAEHQYQKPSKVHFLSPISRRAVYHFLKEKNKFKTNTPPITKVHIEIE